MDYILDLFSKLLTPVIGVTAIYIAYQQYKVHRYKVKIDLFDRRYDVFKKVMEFLSKITIEAKIDETSCIYLLRDTKAAKFLFPDSVANYIEELYKKGINLIRLREEIYENKNLTDEGRKCASEEKESLVKWFSNQFEVTEKIFEKSMKIPK